MLTLATAQAFLQPEQLGSSDSWFCPQCKAHVQADKKLDLWTLPEVLIVHLKRFSFSRTRRTKLDNPVTFPVHGLDLGPYLLRQQVCSPAQLMIAAHWPSRRASFWVKTRTRS